MGATFYTYTEPQKSNVQHYPQSILPSHIKLNDLIRMGIAPDRAKEIILSHGGGGNEPPNNGNINEGGGGRPWDISPYQPKTHQIFRIMAHDHRTGKETQSRFQQGTKIPLSPEVLLRAPPPEIAYKIEHAILESLGIVGKLDDIGQKGKALEVDVALYFGPALTGFNEKFFKPTGGEHGDFDILTDSFIVEVTTASRKKTDQINKYFEVISAEKHVILYAPQYRNKAAIESVESLGAYVARDWNELTQIVRRIDFT